MKLAFEVVRTIIAHPLLKSMDYNSLFFFRCHLCMVLCLIFFWLILPVSGWMRGVTGQWQECTLEQAVSPSWDTHQHPWFSVNLHPLLNSGMQTRKNQTHLWQFTAGNQTHLEMFCIAIWLNIWFVKKCFALQSSIFSQDGPRYLCYCVTPEFIFDRQVRL